MFFAAGLETNHRNDRAEAGSDKTMSPSLAESLTNEEVRRG